MPHCQLDNVRTRALGGFLPVTLAFGCWECRQDQWQVTEAAGFWALGSRDCAVGLHVSDRLLMNSPSCIGHFGYKATN